MADNSRHDLGTDLWLMARDERGYDLGLLVGAQVKSGLSWFKRKQSATDGGQLSGWWFRDRDGKRTHAWATHGVPHLLIFHDDSSRKSYWVHVSAEALVSTGKGSKILVPEHNVLDEHHVQELLAVAGRGRVPIALEGTAWDGRMPAPGAGLRHALLVPRLIAPHPNAGLASAGITPLQAVALLMQGRRSTLRQAAERFEGIPSVREMSSHSDWLWRFAGALHSEIFLSNLNDLYRVRKDAPTPWSRAAASVCVVASLLQQATKQGAVQAIDILDLELADGDTDPIDVAWLRLQRARALLELGRRSEAREDALGVQSVRVVAGDDVTATALAGVAGGIVFNSDWRHGDLGTTIREADTTVSWWRSLATLRGFTAAHEREFQQWSGSGATDFADGDPTQNQLLVSAASASFLGSHGGWRDLTAHAAQDMLIRQERHFEAEATAEYLTELQRSGREKSVERAVKRIIANGPAHAVEQAARLRPLSASTSSSIAADLAMVEHGGDVLQQADAAERVDWLAAALHDPQELLRLDFHRVHRTGALIAECLAGLADVLPLEVASLAVEHLCERDAADVTAYERDRWGQLLWQLDPEIWSSELIRVITEIPRQEATSFDAILLGICAATSDDGASATLMKRAEDDVDSLYALGPLSGLPSVLALAWLDRTAEQLTAIRRRAAAGDVSRGDHDPGALYCVLRSFHDDGTGLGLLFDFLEDRHVPEVNKRGALSVLASNFELLPELRERRFIHTLDVLDHQAVNDRPWLFEGPAPRGSIAFLRTRLQDPVDGRTTVRGLVAGGRSDRQWAASSTEVLLAPEAAGFLTVLLSDPACEVRAAAASAVLRRVMRSEGPDAFEELLALAVADTGRTVPLALVQTAKRDSSHLPPHVVAGLAALSDHPAASVRRGFRRAVGGRYSNGTPRPPPAPERRLRT